MEAVSPGGLIGAFFGLLIGWLDHRIVGGFVERKLRETDRSATPEEKADYERRIVWFRRLFFVMAVGTFPVIGFFIGQAIGG